MTDKLRNMTSIYLLSGEQVLLLYRQGSRVVNDVWVGSAGGHFEERELNDPEACVLRELEEELSVTPAMLEGLALRYVTLRRRGELRINYYFFAELPGGPGMPLRSDEGELRWFPLREALTLEMPFSAKRVLEHYLRRGRYDSALYGGVASGEGVVFTELTAYD